MHIKNQVSCNCGGTTKTGLKPEQNHFVQLEREQHSQTTPASKFLRCTNPFHSITSTCSTAHISIPTLTPHFLFLELFPLCKLSWPLQFAPTTIFVVHTLTFDQLLSWCCHIATPPYCIVIPQWVNPDKNCRPLVRRCLQRSVKLTKSLVNDSKLWRKRLTVTL